MTHHVTFKVDREHQAPHMTDAEALTLLHESLLYSADHLKRHSMSLESLEFVAMDAAAHWVAHLAEAAKGATFMTVESEPITKP